MCLQSDPGRVRLRLCLLSVLMYWWSIGELSWLVLLLKVEPVGCVPVISLSENLLVILLVELF